MSLFKDQQTADTNLRLMDVIKSQQETIDKLTDKIMAQKDVSTYRAYKDEPGEPLKEEKDPFIDPDLISGQEALNADQPGPD